MVKTLFFLEKTMLDGQAQLSRLGQQSVQRCCRRHRVEARPAALRTLGPGSGSEDLPECFPGVRKN